jgi:hypothetical protein
MGCPEGVADMLNLMDSVRSHCAGLDSGMVDMHFRRLPPAYFERYSSAEIARHIRLLATVNAERPLEVEIRPLD